MTFIIDSAPPVTESRFLYCSRLSLWLSSDWQEELEFGWKFILGVKSIGEVNSANTAVGVDLNSIYSKVNNRYNLIAWAAEFE